MAKSKWLSVMKNTSIANNLYRPAQVRELDRLAIESGIGGFELMQRAGKAALELLLECWPSPSGLQVFCGSGNNGGDGYIVATLAAEQGIPVQVICLKDPKQLQGDALLAYGYAVAAGVPCEPFDACRPFQQNSLQPDALGEGVIVDAILGSGLNGRVRKPFAEVIYQINSSGLPVLALDMPSGLCGDTGAELGEAVHADATISFIGHKAGLFTGRGPAVCGEVFLDTLRIPPDIYPTQPAKAQLLTVDSLRDLLWEYLPPRPRDAHKGHFGHVLLIGGDNGLGGAVMLAAEAALRTGAGLVSVATRPQHLSALLARRPEVMAAGVNSGEELIPLLDKATTLIIGPGLGQSPWSQQLLQSALDAGLPMVLDADALNLLAEGSVSLDNHCQPRVITPHPGEAARLLNTDTQSVQEDRFALSQQLVNQTGSVVVLKGAGTLICNGQTTAVCSTGNPGMASGGMGDVLSGIIGALMAQGMSAYRAAQLGVCLHGAAADIVVDNCGERGLVASDLFAPLRELVNG